MLAQPRALAKVNPFEAVIADSVPEAHSELFESAEYQAISKTRLWREIFYLRELLGDKD